MHGGPTAFDLSCGSELELRQKNLSLNGCSRLKVALNKCDV
jgi:hypothetical protein